MNKQEYINEQKAITQNMIQSAIKKAEKLYDSSALDHVLSIIRNMK
jgi:hypothetical protein